MNKNRHKRINSLTVIIICCAGIILLSGCDTLEKITANMSKPTASVKGVALQDLDLNGLTLGFDIEVNNPYSVPLPLTNLSYQLSSDSQQILSGNATQSSSIAAKSSRIINLPAAIQFNDLINTVSKLRPGVVVPYDAAIELAVDAPGVGPLKLPLNKSGEFPIPAVPEVTVGSIQLDSLSLSKAVMLVQLNIKNLNDFPVKMTTLDYMLSLGGQKVAQAAVTDAVKFTSLDTQPVSIALSLSATDIGFALFKMLGGSNANYEIGGQINLDTPFGIMDLPYTSKGDTPLLH